MEKQMHSQHKHQTKAEVEIYSMQKDMATKQKLEEALHHSAYGQKQIVGSTKHFTEGSTPAADKRATAYEGSKTGPTADHLKSTGKPEGQPKMNLKEGVAIGGAIGSLVIPEIGQVISAAGKAASGALKAWESWNPSAQKEAHFFDGPIAKL